MPGCRARVHAVFIHGELVHALLGLSRASIFSSKAAPASPASRVENSLPSSIIGSLADATSKACRVAGDVVRSGPTTRRSNFVTRIRIRASPGWLVD